MIGPVQVLVVGFDQLTFTGEVLAEFTRLREAGLVRLIDVLLVSRSEEAPWRRWRPLMRLRLILVGWLSRYSANRKMHQKQRPQR